MSTHYDKIIIEYFFAKSIDKRNTFVYNIIARRDLRGSGGTGRRARLRGVWFYRTGSIPVSRTKNTAEKVIFLQYFLSKPQAWHIITARSVVDIISPLGCISSRTGVYIYAA